MNHRLVAEAMTALGSFISSTTRLGLDAERLDFLAQAWKAAYAEAKDLGWL
jgi:hypothetical protein